VCTPVLKLCNDLHVRSDILVRLGWHAHLRVLRAPEKYGLTEFLSELTDFEVDFAKRHIGKFAHSPSYFTELRRAAEERYKVTGDYWDRELTGYHRALTKCDAERPIEYQRIYQEIWSEVLRAREEDEEAHHVHHYQSFDAAAESERPVFAATLMRELLKRDGFERQTTSRSASVILFSKPLVGNWSVGILVNSEALRSNPYDVKSRVGFFDAGLLLYQHRFIADARKRPTPYIDFALKFFYPVIRAPFPCVYEQFDSLRGLEALVMVHADMYHSMADDLEAAAREGLAAL
jgi:hypothetical protein